MSNAFALKKNFCTISLRVISITRLWCYHLYTCNLSTWSSPTTLKRNLILWWVSYLYAFSTYPFL